MPPAPRPQHTMLLRRAATRTMNSKSRKMSMNRPHLGDGGGACGGNGGAAAATTAARQRRRRHVASTTSRRVYAVVVSSSVFQICGRCGDAREAGLPNGYTRVLLCRYTRRHRCFTRTYGYTLALPFRYTLALPRSIFFSFGGRGLRRR